MEKPVTFTMPRRIANALGFAARMGFEHALEAAPHEFKPSDFSRGEWTEVEEVITGLENAA